MTNSIVFTKDLTAKKINVIRVFNAPIEKVWKAWTERETLDKWWAPKPWKSETKEMDFTAGGTWIYAMVNPEGQKRWCRVDFTAIEPGHTFSAISTFFCDENGNPTDNMPKMHWVNKFLADGNVTRVEMEISFDNEEDLKTIIEVGFEEGFTTCLNQLDEVLASE